MGSCCSIPGTIEFQNKTVILRNANGFTRYIPIKHIISLKTYDNIWRLEIVTTRDNYVFFSSNKSNYEQNLAYLLAVIQSPTA